MLGRFGKKRRLLSLPRYSPSLRREISAENRWRSDHDPPTGSSVMLSAFSLAPGQRFPFFLSGPKPPRGRGRAASDKSDGNTVYITLLYWNPYEPHKSIERVAFQRSDVRANRGKSAAVREFRAGDRCCVKILEKSPLSPLFSCSPPSPPPSVSLSSFVLQCQRARRLGPATCRSWLAQSDIVPNTSGATLRPRGAGES